jgi:hypothetical protein
MAYGIGLMALMKRFPFMVQRGTSFLSSALSLQPYALSLFSCIRIGGTCQNLHVRVDAPLSVHACQGAGKPGLALQEA